jgi:cytochrome b561
MLPVAPLREAVEDFAVVRRGAAAPDASCICRHWSAARYPIVLYGSLQLPPILPHDVALYALLRTTHTVLAFLLFATFIVHFAAALMHALIYRDGVFPSMASWKA